MLSNKNANIARCDLPHGSIRDNIARPYVRTGWSIVAIQRTPMTGKRTSTAGGVYRLFERSFKFPGPLALALILTAGPNWVRAQEVGAQQPHRQKSGVLEEVIVTAQRREQSLQDVAISMTVLDQEQISNADMSNSGDLAIYTPSLSTNQRFGSENASFSIRGFTQELRTTASVGVYFAEVVAPRGQTYQNSGDGAGPGELFDLRNVQVLKGPQGTLFGRNTTGGAILIEPKEPTDKLGGYVQVSAGNFGMRRRQAVVNIPVNDRFRLRFGVDEKERDGHLDNITDIGADRMGDVNYTSYRLSLLWDMTDSLTNYTILTDVDSDTNGYAPQLFACNPSMDPNETPLFPLISPGCESQLERYDPHGEGFYDTVSTVPTPVTEIDTQRLINKTSWAVMPDITLNNIFGYSYLRTLNYQDFFGTQFPETQSTFVELGLPAGLADPNREFITAIGVRNPGMPVTSQETWVEEVQVQGLSFDGRLDWQAGVYYETSRPDGVSGYSPVVLISCDPSTLEGDPSRYNCFDPTAGSLGSGVQNVELETEYVNKAVYSQATFDVFEWLSVTAGARYTWDDTRGELSFNFHKFTGGVRQQGTGSFEQAKQSSEAPTGLIEIQYRPLPDVMLYGKYVRGYRQGSVNMAADPGIQTHDQETVDTYEIGAKTTFNWLVSGRFNVALFDNEFKGMQLQAGYISPNKGATTAIFNAGSSEIRGAEAELFVRIFEGLTLSASYSRLITELLEQENNREKVEEAGGSLAGVTFIPIAEVGDELPFAPDKAYTASLNYRLPLPESIGEISLGTTYVYTGEQRAAASSASPFAMLDAYSLQNYNLGWAAILRLPLDLSVFVTNVHEERYTTYISGAYNALGFENRQVGQPRMYGARLRYRF